MSTDPADKSESSPTPDLKKANSGKTRTSIPEPRVPSPELEAEYERRSRERKKRDWRKRLFRNAAALCIFLGIPVAIVLYGSLSNRENNRNDRVASKPLSSFDRLLADEDPKQLMEYSDSFVNAYRSGDVPMQLMALRQRIQIADKLVAMNKNEWSLEYGILSKLDALMALVAYSIYSDLNQRADSQELIGFSKKHVDGQDITIKNRANLGVLVSKMHDYMFDISDENFDGVKKQLEQFVASLEPELTFIRELKARLCPLINKSGRDEHAREFKILLGTNLAASSNQEISKVGSDILDEAIIGTVDFEGLRRLVFVQDPDSLSGLQKIVDTIWEHPGASLNAIQNTLTTVEILRQINRGDMETQLINKLRQSTEKIDDQISRETVIKAIDDYDTRSELPGKVFDLFGINDKDVQNEQLATVIVFFSPNVTRSIDWITSLHELDDTTKSNARFVLVCIEKAFENTLAEEPENDFSNDVLISHTDCGHYLEQCPVSTVPYVIVLGRDQRVVRMNVFIDQIRGILKTLN